MLQVTSTKHIKSDYCYLSFCLDSTYLIHFAFRFTVLKLFPKILHMKITRNKE